MPVFDFSSTPENEKKQDPICTYTTFRSNEGSASAEKPILILDNSSEKWNLLKENAAAIIAGISVGTLVSLGSALALALALGLTREQYATLLPKSVTTAISMDVAAELGGIAALTGAIVILTGIAGNLLAEVVCKIFHITDPIAKGVGIGTSAHAVGTSKALQMGEVEGAMSGLSIAVAGVLTAVLCPFFVSFIQ